MNRFLLLVFLLGTTSVAQAAVVYSYTGNTYDTVINYSGDGGLQPYDTSMRITGTLVLAEELVYGAYNPYEVLSYSFSDGINTLTNENSDAIFGEIAVDEDGIIQLWDLFRFSFSEDASNGETQRGQRIETSFATFGGFPALDKAVNFECLEFVEIYVCGNANDHEASIASAQGV